ncbi:MAG: hypothetical protein AAB391_00480 [Patescibacteria group bacterium]
MSKEKNNTLWQRLAFDVCLVAAICWFPWWASLILATVAFFSFSEFVELILVGLMIDTLYASHQTFSVSSYTYFLFSIGLFIILSLVKRQLR